VGWQERAQERKKALYIAKAGAEEPKCVKGARTGQGTPKGVPQDVKMGICEDKLQEERPLYMKGGARRFLQIVQRSKGRRERRSNPLLE